MRIVVIVPNIDFCELMIVTYFASGCAKDIDILKEYAEYAYCVSYGKQYSGLDLEYPLTEEQEQWVIDNITAEEQ